MFQVGNHVKYLCKSGAQCPDVFTYDAEGNKVWHNLVGLTGEIVERTGLQRVIGVKYPELPRPVSHFVEEQDFEFVSGCL